MTYPVLNLPQASVRVRKRDGRTEVFDPLRQRFVALTPEEWVRQNFTAYLIHHKHYPAVLMANEVSITLGAVSRRCDTVVYGRDSQPRMIVEYKATTVQLTQRVFDQITRYNMVLHTPWLIVSNGLQHVCCKVDYEAGHVSFVEQIPDYSEL